MPGKSDQKPYDSTLKGLVQEYAEEMVPLLLEGAVFEEVLNVEAIRPVMRADQVFKVWYHGEHHILHLEFESSSDPNMEKRLWVYHTNLHLTYDMPVISMIIYPFKVQMAHSPYREMGGNRERNRFNFEVLALWQLQASAYLEQRVRSMYPLLPTMAGVTKELLLQAMEDIIQYYQDNQVAISRQFIWMGIMVRRSTILSVEDKKDIQRGLSMYDDLWENDPEIQRIKAEAEARGRADAEAKAREAEARAQEVEARARATTQDILVSVVKARFPTLVEVTQQQLDKVTQLDDLSKLTKLLVSAPDENTARWLLDTYAA